jgi:hypothetical protein
MGAVGHQEPLENGSFLVSQRGRKPFIQAASADKPWFAGLRGVVRTSCALSQVVLAFRQPVAIVPLVMFTCDNAKRGVLMAPGWLTLVASVAPPSSSR